jgi:integrase
MNFIKTKNGYKSIVRIKGPEGRIVERRAYARTRELLKAEIERVKAEIRQTPASSLKVNREISTFGDIIDFYTERNGYVGMETLFLKLKRDLGSIQISEISEKFDQYILILKKEPSRTGKPRTPATINRYIACAKIACQFACKRSYKKVTGLEENPLADFEYSAEEGRDRVLSEEEKQRIFTALMKLESYLYWAFYFSLKNPIRKDDLINLTRDNLDEFKPWVHHYPSKTRKRKPREAVLPFLDEQLMQYFKSLPAECPYLFPKINKDGSWSKLPDFRKHWETVLREAKVQDFRWHDLKHCAITWILDNGYSERDIKNLGIQYDSKMIDRYYNRDATKVLLKWQNKGKLKADEGTMKEFIVKAG